MKQRKFVILDRIFTNECENTANKYVKKKTVPVVWKTIDLNHNERAVLRERKSEQKKRMFLVIANQQKSLFTLLSTRDERLPSAGSRSLFSFL